MWFRQMVMMLWLKLKGYVSLFWLIVKQTFSLLIIPENLKPGMWIYCSYIDSNYCIREMIVQIKSIEKESFIHAYRVTLTHLERKYYLRYAAGYWSINDCSDNGAYQILLKVLKKEKKIHPLWRELTFLENTKEICLLSKNKEGGESHSRKFEVFGLRTKKTVLPHFNETLQRYCLEDETLELFVQCCEREVNISTIDTTRNYKIFKYSIEGIIKQVSQAIMNFLDSLVQNQRFLVD